MLARGGARQLGNRALRVPDSGSRQSNRVGSNDLASVKNFAGGDFIVGLRSLRTVFRETTDRLELFVGGFLYRRRRLLYFQRLGAELAFCSLERLEMSELNETTESSPRALRAKAFFEQGYNCAQAVVLAFDDETGFDPKTAAKVASSFGGGMGRLREVCGAVSGMFLALGASCGTDDPDDAEGKKAQYQDIQALAAKYREENGSNICRELLGLSEKTSEPTPERRTNEYYRKRPCGELVACAAQILDEYFAKKKGENV